MIKDGRQMEKELDTSKSEIQEPVIFEFYLGVTRCPPGNALHCGDLNNRGHSDWPEITVWPKREHYRLTTGGESGGLGLPQPVELNSTEKRMAQILGLNELELGIFLREWTVLRSTDSKRVNGEKKLPELGPEGRPKELDDLLRSYNQSAYLNQQEKIEKQRHEGVKTVQKHRLGKLKSYKIPKKEENNYLEVLGDLEPKDYTDLVRILKEDGENSAVGWLRFHAIKKVDKRNKAVQTIKMLRRFEGI